MRKILALLLVTALIPFLTGCRIDGLWGYDDDDSTVTPSVANNLNIAVQLPAAFAMNSVRAADAGAEYSIFVKVYTTVSNNVNGWFALDSKLVDGKWTYFTPNLTGDMVELENGKLKFRIVKNADPTKEITFTAGQPTTTSTTSGQTSEVLIVIKNTLPVNSGGTTLLDIDVYTNNDSLIDLVPSTGIITTVTITATGIDATSGDTNASDETPAGNYLLWTSLTVSSDDGTTYQNASFDKNSPTYIPAETPDMNGAKFKIAFQDAVASADEALELVVTNANTGAVVATLNKTSGLTLAYDSPTKTLSITVNKSVALTAGVLYSLKVSSASVRDLTGAKGLELPLYTFFQVLSANVTKLTNWPGKNGSLVPFSPAVYTLTFSKELKSAQNITATFRFERYSVGGTTLEHTATVSVTNNVSTGGTFAINGSNLVITLANPLVSDKMYKVYYVSGSILDVDGNAVAVYPNPMTFSTAN